jgi:hypothetical protein
MGSSNETACYGPASTPGRSTTAADAGRVLGRVGRGGGGEPLPRRDRHRHRRLDPPARGLHRHRRHQAHLRALLALGDRRLRLVARSGRADDAHGARRGDHAAGDGRARSEGFDLADLPVPDFEAALTGDIRGKRIGIPANTAWTACPTRSRTLWSRARDAARRGRRDRRHLAAAHEIRAASLLRHRAGRGVVEPRPLRRRALRPPGKAFAGRRHHRDVREDPRRGLRPRGAAPRDDRHLCAVGGLLRRLLQPRAQGPGADQARLRAGLRAAASTRS